MSFICVNNNSFSNERLSNKTRHEKEVQGNSEMSYSKRDVTLGWRFGKLSVKIALDYVLYNGRIYWVSLHGSRGEK